MIGFLLLAMLLWMAAGCLMNYIGVECMRMALELAGGDAIGAFLTGILFIIIGTAGFVSFTMCGRALLLRVKEVIKNES